MAQELPSLNLVYEAAQKALDAQFAEISSLDTKASISLGASGVILAALIGFLTEKPSVGIQALIIRSYPRLAICHLICGCSLGEAV